MATVTKTDQLGRLIELCGNAIALTRDSHRDPTKLLYFLQAFKENKNPDMCCGYPRYEKPGRPDFGPTQIRYLCELTPGMLIRERKKYDPPEGILLTVLDFPRKDGSSWVVLVKGHTTGNLLYLTDFNIQPYNDNIWNEYNWLSYDSPVPCPHHHCDHHHRS